MVSVATMRELDPEQFSQAADGYHALGNMSDEAKRKISDHIVGQMDRKLEGDAAKAALKALRGLAENFHYTQTECGLVRATLNALASDLRAAKKKFDAAEEVANTAKFTVNSDGSVTYPPGGDEVDGKKPEGGTARGSAKSDPTGNVIDPTATANSAAEALERQAANVNPNPNHRKAVDIANDIAEALADATRADKKWTTELRGLKADDDLHVSRKDWVNVKNDMKDVRKDAGDYLEPPKKGSPEANAKWWKGLSKEERDDYVSLHPASIGAMDGLPSAARDEANRTVLAEAKAQYGLEKSAIPPEPLKTYTWITGGGGFPVKVPSDEWTAWDKKYGDRYKHLDSSLKGMRSIEERFERTGERGLPDAYLLGFSPEDNGRAIVANGDPDKAAHQAVYVPGTTSNLEKVDGDIDRATELWREAQASAGAKPVSTVTWLGYDAPQDIVKDSPFSHYADDGAPAFNRFMDGLDASHTGDSEPHRTAVGHSYGTTLIGSAARQGDLNADDVIFAGSPGAQVGSAEEMDVPKGHVWNQEADGDKVPDIGRYGHGGSQWSFGGGVWINPSDEVFGANQMTTGEDSWNGQKTVGSEGHSQYWEPGSSSLRNQAEVIAGKHGSVHLED